MNQRSKNIAAGGLGFVTALAATSVVNFGKPAKPAPAPDVDRQPVAKPESHPIVSLPRALETLASPRESAATQSLLEFADAARTSNANEREAALARLLEMSETERRVPLELLLLRWADDDPGAVVTWCRDHLDREERDTVMKGVLSTWAQRDGMGCGQWWAENLPQPNTADTRFFRLLSNADPLAFATMMDMQQMHGIRMVGGIDPLALPAPEHLPALAEAVVGNVGYDASQPDELTANSSARHLTGKSAWNELFEQVAVAWHSESPEACEQWLQGFPTEAQTAARSRIENPRDHLR